MSEIIASTLFPANSLFLAHVIALDLGVTEYCRSWGAPLTGLGAGSARGVRVIAGLPNGLALCI